MRLSRQIIDVRIELGTFRRALLLRQMQETARSQFLQVAQSCVFAAMCVACELTEKLRRLRTMPFNMLEPAQLTRCWAHVSALFDVVESGATEAVCM